MFIKNKCKTSIQMDVNNIVHKCPYLYINASRTGKSMYAIWTQTSGQFSRYGDAIFWRPDWSLGYTYTSAT